MDNRLFESEMAVKLGNTIFYIAFYMSIPLNFFFWIADINFMPDLIWICFAIRSLIIPVCIVTVFLCKQLGTYRELQRLAVFFTACHSLIICALIGLNDGFGSWYYAGLNLVTLGSIAFMPLTARYRIYQALMIFVPYYLVGAFHIDTLNDFYYKAMASNSFFIVGTLAISFLIASFSEKLHKSEFATREKLKNEITNRDQVIKTQTDENVYARLLSRQFSPQVISAIKLGKVEDIRLIQRKKVCVIFVDIEGSTARIVRLDKDDAAHVIAMFMEDVMSLLLKYDITIDKFLGDGILAFSNHPNTSEDFVEGVVDSALEICKRIKERRAEYLEYWRNELQVTIGIDVGYANVGIYGANNILQTFTAIGEVVNLAKRLSSEAKPNQILVSQAVWKSLTPDAYQGAFVGEKSFKGFESDILKVYEIKQRTMPQQFAGIELCPNDNGVLSLVKDDNGIYVLMCRECGFRLDASQRVPDMTHAKLLHAS